MQDALLLVSVIVILAVGGLFMKKLDQFLEEDCQAQGCSLKQENILCGLVFSIHPWQTVSRMRWNSFLKSIVIFLSGFFAVQRRNCLRGFPTTGWM